MPALTPQVLMDVESRMHVIVENEYTQRLLSNIWWDTIAKTRTTGARRDVLLWLLSTAQIRDTGPEGGNIDFEDLVSQTTEITVSSAGVGLKLNRFQLEDTDGSGMQLAAQWSADVGAYMAYWPQKLASDVLKNGQSSKYIAYDKQNFFSTAHPVNPARSASGTFANLFTGAAAGVYPGALPIDDSVPLETASQNLAKLFSYVTSIKMPNGEDPRGLSVGRILCGPRLFPRAVQLSTAKYIPSAVGAGVGTADVEALVKALGYAAPVLVPELAGYENDTTYFVVGEQASASQLGALIYTQREAFRINYYGAENFPELNRRDEIEWHCKGRNSMTVGHPYALFKVKAT